MNWNKPGFYTKCEITPPPPIPFSFPPRIFYSNRTTSLYILFCFYKKKRITTTKFKRSKAHEILIVYEREQLFIALYYRQPLSANITMKNYKIKNCFVKPKGSKAKAIKASVYFMIQCQYRLTYLPCCSAKSLLR